jgi:hypothetical protein
LLINNLFIYQFNKGLKNGHFLSDHVNYHNVSNIDKVGTENMGKVEVDTDKAGTGMAGMPGKAEPFQVSTERL